MWNDVCFSSTLKVVTRALFEVCGAALGLNTATARTAAAAGDREQS